MNRYLILLVFSFSFLQSCRPSYVESQLLDIESYIMDRPDSALTVLESMDRSLLDKEEYRAHHALLHAMALDKNFVNVDDDSLAQVAVDYYSKNGPEKYYARSLYYLGVAYYYQKEYKKAIVEFTKAEEVSAVADSLYLGMVKVKKSDSFHRTYNDVEAFRHLLTAKEIFSSLSLEYYMSTVDLDLARAYFNFDMHHVCGTILDSLIKHTTNSKIQTAALTDYAYLNVLSQTPDYVLADRIYGEVFSERDNSFMTFEDYWAWAYALNAVGRQKEAQNFIDQLVEEESGTTSYWQYMIAKYDGDMLSALAHLEDYIKHNDVEVSDALKQSLALTQRDYYEAQSELSKQQAQNSRLWMLVILTSSMFALLIVAMVIVWYVKKQDAIKEQYLTYINEIRHQLEESKKDDYPALKKKYLSLYKSKFEIIGELCEQYIYSQGLVNAEKSIYRKVVSLVDDFTNDYSNKEKFDAMLDEDLDNVMTNLRAEMPFLKDKDYMIFSFLVIGFDVTTISNLLNITPNTVYIRKSRIKHQILEQNPTHKDQFIEAIC